jgi:hypothetical protein
MATAVEQSIQAIVFVVQVVPIGTNIGLVRLLWAMMNGSFLRSRGAIFPALLLNGFTPAEIRRSWVAFAYGSWKIEELLEIWCIYVASKNEWREHCIAGLRVVSIDITGFWRPQLKGWLGKHYHHWAGKALPAVVMGVMVTSGRIHGRRIPLLHTLLRCKPETSEAEFRVELLKKAASRPDSREVKVLDGGFKISEIQAAKLCGYVVRMANNCTAHRNQLPIYKGNGRYPEYGETVRPLARAHGSNTIPATKPDKTSLFTHAGRTIEVHSWSNLVSSTTKVDPDASTLSIYVFFDPAYKKPLVLATDLNISAEDVYLIYKDRWPVEQSPLAAKQMIGLHRQFVFAHLTCFRLPELALLAGNMLTYIAAVLPAIPSGFWDRQPQATPGRLRRLLATVDFPDLAPFDPELRKKDSVSDHLPKGVDAHRRHKQLDSPQNTGN